MVQKIISFADDTHLYLNNLLTMFYPSKILLFGEYTVISGSDALALPLDKFRGCWNYRAEKPERVMLDFAEYLKIKSKDNFNLCFNYDLMFKDLNAGLFFDSNIPEGYGAGSSGALTAAVYDSYFETKHQSISELKSILAEIENFFHSSSSGIDPLVSYIRRLIKLTGGNKIEIVEPGKISFSDYNFYLLDSGKPRLTKHFVDIYKRKMNDPQFRRSYIDPQSILTNSIINRFLNNQEHDTFELFRNISELQFSEMTEMILPELTVSWQIVLQSGEAAIKLCGAGGGGFYLVMAKKDYAVNEKIKEIKLVKLDGIY